MRLTAIALALICATAIAGEAPKSVAARNAMTRYATAKEKLDAEYDARLQAMERQLVADLRAAMTAATKAGNLEEANAIKAEIDKMGDHRPITIKALIDGESELHISQAGMYWTQGNASKPGRHEGRNDPTFVNSIRWLPKWSKDGERGPDRSEPLEVRLAKSYVVDSVLADGSPADHLVSAKQVGDETVVSIPDRGRGSRLYVFTLAPR